KGEHFVPLQIVELVTTMTRPAEGGTLLVDPEFPEHATGQVFDIELSNLPRGERECLNFILDDMGWDGYLGFIQVTGNTLHIVSARIFRNHLSGSHRSEVIMIGQTLRQYRIEANLGGGKMGAVYRARDTQLERPVAIRILPDRAALGADRPRVMQEAKSAF